MDKAATLELVGLPATTPTALAARMMADGFNLYQASEAIGVATVVLRDVLEHAAFGEPLPTVSEVALRPRDRDRILSYCAFGADPGEEG